MTIPKPYMKCDPGDQIIMINSINWLPFRGKRADRRNIHKKGTNLITKVILGDEAQSYVENALKKESDSPVLHGISSRFHQPSVCAHVIFVKVSNDELVIAVCETDYRIAAPYVPPIGSLIKLNHDVRWTYWEHPTVNTKLRTKDKFCLILDIAEIGSTVSIEGIHCDLRSEKNCYRDVQLMIDETPTWISLEKDSFNIVCSVE